MRLTLHTDYALRVLMYLGLRPDGLASIHEIAEAYRISENHLTKVVHGLGRNGFVETLRGRGGGLRLARPAAEIPVGAVVRQTEEDMALVACFEGGPGCIIAGPCLLQPLLREALEAFLAVLDRVTLAQLIGPHRAAIARQLGLDVPATG
ncbi:MAG TPA: Rrf2 family transcriptional regulator [Roseomonas sp.]|jgi:Rrf2 family nitric oxide-sensitive transcriptional repressor